MSYCHTNASGGVRRPPTFENKYSNIFVYKTTGPTVLKFNMEHDLTPGSQNCKIGLGRISKMAAVTKNNKKQQNKVLLQNHWILLAEFWHGISVKHRYSEL